MTELNKEGVWVPYSILRYKEIPTKEIVLLMIIHYEYKYKGECRIKNKELCKIFNMSIKHVSRIISKLEKRGYIETEILTAPKTKRKIGRSIKTTKYVEMLLNE